MIQRFAGPSYKNKFIDLSCQSSDWFQRHVPVNFCNQFFGHKIQENLLSIFFPFLLYVTLNVA